MIKIEFENESRCAWFLRFYLSFAFVYT